MRRLLGTVIIVATAAVFSAGSVSASHVPQDYPPRPGATPIVIGLPGLNPPSASGSGTESAALSPAQRASARTLVMQDQYVRALIAGRPHGPASSFPWVGTRKQLMGAVVRIPFQHPVTVGGQWLALPRKPFRASYRHVVALRAFVDLGRRQVVALVPTTR